MHKSFFTELQVLQGQLPVQSWTNAYKEILEITKSKKDWPQSEFPVFLSESMNTSWHLQTV